MYMDRFKSYKENPVAGWYEKLNFRLNVGFKWENENRFSLEDKDINFQDTRFLF